MTAAIDMSHTTSPTPSNGARLVATDGRTLPLTRTSVVVDAAGGIARVVLSQHFHNPYSDPLAVTYSLPLPADGAVSGFAFRIGEKRVVGEIDRKKKARERYEQALVEGRSAAILEQDRSSLFTQEIGNIPAGEEVVAEVIIDQRLRWLDEGSWEWRFPTVVAPRYLGEPGRVPDAARVFQDVAEGPIAARASLQCRIRDAIPAGKRPESPSHAIAITSGNEGVSVALREGAELDRDLVVRWAAAARTVGLVLDAGRPPRGQGADKAAYGLLTIVPPSTEASQRSIARDMIVLLDTSGSMDGEPLAQAVRVVSALVDTLREEDQLEMIEFSSHARRWKKGPAAATASARREALAWLKALRASGSTEMREGIMEALKGLREGTQRQVVLVTDGQIGFESQVVEAIQSRLPASSRLHTVGVGSAVNRSLTGPAARAGRGVEVVIGLGEDPEGAAWRVVSRTRAPIVVDLEIEGPGVIDHAPARLPDLFAGAPALIGVALRPEGGEIRVRGRVAGGGWEQRVAVPALAPGEGSQAAAALYGREITEDLEMRLAAGEDRRAIDRAIEQAGLDFQISTRLTSWVAVTKEITVDAGAPLRRERMPHALPHGMSAEGVGLRRARAQIQGFAAPAAAMAAPSLTDEGMLEETEDGDGFADETRAAPMPPAPYVIHQPSGAAKSTGAPPVPPYAQPRPAAAPPPAAQAPMPILTSPARPAPLQEPAAEAKPGFFERVKRFISGEAERTAAPAADEPAPPAEPAEEKETETAREEMADLGRGRRRAEPAEKAKKAAPEAPKGAASAAGPVARPAPKPAGKKKKATEGAPGRRALRGRVAVLKEDALIVEVTVDGVALDWAPDGKVELLLADGTTVTATVVSNLSTRAGQIAAGQNARLCVALRGRLAAAPRRLTLRSGEVDLIIDL